MKKKKKKKKKKKPKLPASDLIHEAKVLLNFCESQNVMLRFFLVDDSFIDKYLAFYP